MPDGSCPTPDDVVRDWDGDFVTFASEAIMLNVAEERRDALGIEEREVPFVLNPGQQMLLDISRDQAQQRKMRRLRVLVLKARQVGSTTFWVLWFLWICIFQPGSRIVIVAQHRDSAAAILRNIAAFACHHLPEWFSSRLKYKAVTETITFGNGSTMFCATANSEFLRSGSLDGVLFTEVTSYDDFQTTLTAVTRACAGPVIVESTAKGLGLFKDMWESPRSSWRKLFISWLIDPFCHLEHTNIEPTAENLVYIAEHKLTRTQTNWYLETLWTEFAGNQKQFDQECPATPSLAFITAGTKFFVGRTFQFDHSLLPWKGAERVDYQKPIPGHKYALGVDVAQGSVDNDDSTAILLDVTDLKRISVASVTQCWKAIPLFGDDLVKLAKDYGNVVAVIENNIGLELTRLFRKNSIKQYKKQTDDTMTVQVDEYGFTTTLQSRPTLMAHLTRYIMGNIIDDLRDPRLMDQCNTFVYNKQGKPEKSPGKRDGLVLGMGLALEAIAQYSLFDTPPAREVIPPRPTNDINAMVQWDIRFGTKTRRS